MPLRLGELGRGKTIGSLLPETCFGARVNVLSANNCLSGMRLSQSLFQKVVPSTASSITGQVYRWTVPSDAGAMNVIFCGIRA